MGRKLYLSEYLTQGTPIGNKSGHWTWAFTLIFSQCEKSGVARVHPEGVPSSLEGRGQRSYSVDEMWINKCIGWGIGCGRGPPCTFLFNLLPHYLLSLLFFAIRRGGGGTRIPVPPVGTSPTEKMTQTIQSLVTWFHKIKIERGQSPLTYLRSHYLINTYCPVGDPGVQGRKGIDHEW